MHTYWMYDQDMATGTQNTFYWATQEEYIAIFFKKLFNPAFFLEKKAVVVSLLP